MNVEFEDITIIKKPKSDEVEKDNPHQELYRFPFKLSQTPPEKWIEIYRRCSTRQHPPSRRSWVEGDRLSILCPTDEIEEQKKIKARYVSMTNEAYRKHLEDKKKKKELAAQKKEEEKKKIDDALDAL